ncbi:helix-turn-helix domain-containing protein [Nocardia goodfellowii]
MNPDEVSEYRTLLQRLQSRPTVSVADAAQLLGIGRSTVYGAVKSGEVPAVRVGNRVRIPSRWVREILQLQATSEAVGTRGNPQNEGLPGHARRPDTDSAGRELPSLPEAHGRQ